MSAPEIVVGACYRDPSEGEVVRALRVDRDGLVLVRRVGDDWPGCVCERFEDLRFGHWERVPDPTPAVIDDETDHEREADASFALQEVARLRAQIRTLTAEVAKAEERVARKALDLLADEWTEADVARICAEARAKGGE